MVRSLLCCVALSMLLMGCVKPEIIDRPVPVTVYVPAELRTCPSIPSSANLEDQAAVSDFTTQLHYVARTCKAHLGGVNKVLTDHEMEIAKSASALN